MEEVISTTEHKYHTETVKRVTVTEKEYDKDKMVEAVNQYLKTHLLGEYRCPAIYLCKAPGSDYYASLELEDIDGYEPFDEFLKDDPSVIKMLKHLSDEFEIQVEIPWQYYVEDK